MCTLLYGQPRLSTSPKCVLPFSTKFWYTQSAQDSWSGGREHHLYANVCQTICQCVCAY